MGEVGGFGTRPYGLSVVMVDFWDSPGSESTSRAAKRWGQAFYFLVFVFFILVLRSFTIHME